MKEVKKQINAENPVKTADFFSLFKKIKSEINSRNLDADKKIKIAFLSSFTAKGFKEVLFVKCCQIGILPEIYIADYNQYNQEILNENSEFYKFSPDLVIVFIDLKSLMGDDYFFPYSLSSEERKELIEQKMNECASLIDKIKSNLDAKILFHNFEVPMYSPLGVAESKQEFGFIESIGKLNSCLRDQYKIDSQVYIFDFNAFVSKIGKQNIIDDKMYYLADLKIALGHLPDLCEEYLSYLKSLVIGAKKCIVLDLDNTLWGGVVGEEGLAGIKLGPTPEGRSFWEFQKHLLSLFERGVILAVNSKNNFADAIKVFREHPDMILREEHFASMQINWNDKAGNLRAIAEELNIGLDSLVFFDDDKLNRELVKSELPEVLTVDLPEDPSLYARTLLGLNDFSSLQITEEDKNKGKMYVEQRKRKEFKSNVADITEYLKGLEMAVDINTVNALNTPRISQLTQKTNQFNMTARRYGEEDIKRLQKDHLVVTLRLKDKFGDNGIAGLAIVEKSQDQWRLDIFLLSCRIIGRKVEETLLAFILDHARQAEVQTLIGEFIPTEKNAPAKDFYQKSGFEFVGAESCTEKWLYNVSRPFPYPEFIKVRINQGDEV